MEKRGVLGGQPLFRWTLHRRRERRKNLFSVFLIEQVAYLSVRQVFKGLDLCDREHPFHKSTALFEIDTIALMDFAEGRTSDFRETAFNRL